MDQEYSKRGSRPVTPTGESRNMFGGGGGNSG